MPRVEKTVFISYRRTNAPWALAIFQNLNNNGYDVFFDYDGVASGDFESVILGNIKARAHFIVLLTPSALERCSKPGDWLRREIETALAEKRNIVPLMLEGFDFGSPTIASQLTGKLAALKRYNALDVPASYFLAAMERLRERFLNVPLEGVLHPAPLAAQEAAENQQMAASDAAKVQEEELTAQQWFERGFDAQDLDEKIRFYGKAIDLKPDYAVACYNRGVVRQDQGDLESAIADFSEAIRLKPDHASAFYNRGIALSGRGDLKGAIADYTEAIRLKPDHASAFYNRGIALSGQGDLEGAIADYTEAIRLKPGHASAFNNRGNARRRKGDLEGAIADFSEAIRLKPDHPSAFNNRGNARRRKGDWKERSPISARPSGSSPTMPVHSTTGAPHVRAKGTGKAQSLILTRPSDSNPTMPMHSTTGAPRAKTRRTGRAQSPITNNISNLEVACGMVIRRKSKRKFVT